MIHNLTDKQLQALRKIIHKIQAGEIKESFLIGITPRQGFREIVLLNNKDESGWLDSGILIALVAAKILECNPAISNRYTITARAYEVAAFDFDNPELDPLSVYRKEVYRLIKKHFNREELEGLCFELDVQPDWVFGGKADWPLHLLLYLYRQNRLGDLSPVLENLRPGIDWLPYPDDETAVN